MKIKDNGGLDFIPLYSISFIALFGARRQVEQETLGCVLSPPVPDPGSASLSMVLNAGAGQGLGLQGDPLGKHLEKRFCRGNLQKAIPCLERYWVVWNKEVACKPTTVK